jgi:hypothetical protein
MTSKKTMLAKALVTTCIGVFAMFGCQRQFPTTRLTLCDAGGIRSLSQAPSSSQPVYSPMSFDLIGNFQMDQNLPDNASIPDSARRYNGRKVVLNAEMFVTDSEASLVDHFLLCDPRDSQMMHFPARQKLVVAYTAPGGKVRSHDQWLVNAYGTLEVGVPESDDPEQWQTDTVYRLRLDRLDMLGPVK